MRGCILTYYRFKGRTFVSSGFPRDGTLISASAVPRCRYFMELKYVYMIHKLHVIGINFYMLHIPYGVSSLVFYAHSPRAVIAGRILYGIRIYLYTPHILHGILPF